jgi:hypothetical protein
MRAWLFFAVASVTLAFGGAGCAGSGSVATTTVTAGLRVLHGSPDVGAVDVRLNAAGGKAIATSLTYGRVSTYDAIAPGAYAVAILPAGGSTPTLTCTGAALSAGKNYTVVIGGSVGKGIGTSIGLQCELFAEPTFATGSGDFTFSLHHASPAAAALGDSTVSFGIFIAGSTAYDVPSGTVTFPGSIGTAVSIGTYVTSKQLGVTTAPGVGMWVSPPTSAPPLSVLTTILPSAGQAGAAGVSGEADTGNVLPFGSLVNFSLYLIDVSGGASTKLVGAFD